jgi:hypothetical protein
MTRGACRSVEGFGNLGERFFARHTFEEANVVFRPETPHRRPFDARHFLGHSDSNSVSLGNEQLYASIEMPCNTRAEALSGSGLLLVYRGPVKTRWRDASGAS